jgi:hypothetical protein
VLVKENARVRESKNCARKHRESIQLYVGGKREGDDAMSERRMGWGLIAKL